MKVKTSEELLRGPLDIPDDPAKVTDEQFHEARRQAAVLIRKYFWLGNTTPTFPKNWSMGRELNVWGRLAKEYGPRQVNGAIIVARPALGLPGNQPITMLLFNAKDKRNYLNRCIQEWQKTLVDDGGADKAGEILRKILRGES
jgi:hypothetical protein